MKASARFVLLGLGAAMAAGCSTTDVWPLARNQSVAYNVDASIPDTVRAPRGHILLGHVTGRGVATFTLQADPRDPDRVAWVVTNDEGGDLFDEGGHVIGHRSGDTWAGNNGSQLSAQPVAHVHQRGRLPLALYQATGHEGRGLLAEAQFVQRVHTVGGPPVAAIRHADVGTSIRAEYAADYYFYGGIPAQNRVERGASY
ncbi:MAG TPA: DUF3455 domain-containing protein [Tepidisphaeraceae bacterium]|nr:DUF3455 domain-containing protein [Tepidisphaeraceae bacterium]